MTESQFDIANSALTGLNLPEVAHAACHTILDDCRTNDILTDRNARGVIAGVIYIAAIQTSNRLTQRQIAEVMRVSESTIYKYYMKIAKMLGLCG